MPVHIQSQDLFTHLFVDIKHMRPVTGFSVADLTF